MDKKKLAEVLKEIVLWQCSLPEGMRRNWTSQIDEALSESETLPTQYCECGVGACLDCNPRTKEPSETETEQNCSHGIAKKECFFSEEEHRLKKLEPSKTETLPEQKLVGCRECDYFHKEGEHIKEPGKNEHDERIRAEFKKEIIKTVEEAKGYANWTHTKGNHADDPQDAEICDCMYKERSIINKTYEAVLSCISLLV